MSDGPRMFHGYHYRTSSRFGSRVTLVLEGGTATVTGPRLGLGTYRLWIAAQAVLLALAALSLVAAVVLLDWRLVVALVLFLGLHLAVGGFGAGCLWELQNLIAFLEGTKGDSQSFPLPEIEDVRIGSGWARRGMWLLLLPWFKGIDSIAQGVAVSFVAPDGTPDGGVYAIHLHTPEEAQTLASILRET